MTEPKLTVERAKALRRALTPPEARLWISLKLRPGGLKFRRRHPLGPFILDFYGEAARLAVEVDGEGHGFGDNPERDASRDAWLAGRGVLVLRIVAEEVRTNLEGVLDGIVDEAGRRL